MNWVVSICPASPARHVLGITAATAFDFGPFARARGPKGHRRSGPLTVVVRWFAAVSLEVPISSDERWRAVADRSGSESHIVVGVDGSVGSIEALKWAARWAEHTGGSIQAVYAWQRPSAFGVAYVPPDWQPEDDARAVLEEAIRAAFGDVRPAGLAVMTFEGPAAPILEAASQDAQLLVVGSRGHARSWARCSGR
jgi:nucleotide-binding universal stress UspA family protein